MGFYIYSLRDSNRCWEAAVRALDGGVCPKDFYRLPKEYAYGIGCAFVEKNLAGLPGKAGLVGLKHAFCRANCQNRNKSSSSKPSQCSTFKGHISHILQTQGCRCPSVLDVCATELRFRSLHDLHDELLARTVSALGYCRTGVGRAVAGAWAIFVCTCY